jgi:hypothetical protein
MNVTINALNANKLHEPLSWMAGPRRYRSGFCTERFTRRGATKNSLERFGCAKARIAGGIFSSRQRKLWVHAPIENKLVERAT